MSSSCENGKFMQSIADIFVDMGCSVGFNGVSFRDSLSEKGSKGFLDFVHNRLVCLSVNP